MFSKERFDHLFVAADISDYQYTTVDLGRGLSSIGYISEGKSSEISEIKRGVLLPSDASMNRVSYEYLKNFMEILSQKGVSYRMIAEKIFNECWNDIDEVHYEENAIHPMTLRMVKGFVASGGVALTIPS
jgi:hypothetical protein